MPKHLHCCIGSFVSLPQPRQPQKSFRWVGGRGPENARASARVSTRGRLETDIYDGQTKWRRKTT